MSPHFQSSRIGIVARQHLHQSGVAPRRDFVAGRDIVKPVEDQQMILLEQIVKWHTTRALRDSHMELEVEGLNGELEVGIAFLPPRLFDHVLQARAERSNLLPLGGAGPLAKHACRLSLQGLSTHVAIAHVLRSRNAYASAYSRSALH